MLLACDGLRTANHANFVVDLPSQSVTANVNTSGVEMTNYAQLLVVGICNAITGSGVGNIQLQESDDNTNFTNVTNAALSFNSANTVKELAIDWRKPGRKRYARLQASNTTNAATLVAVTNRLMPKNLPTISQGNNVVTLDS